MTFAISIPRFNETPGMKRASVPATCSKVLWSSLHTITFQGPPSPLPGVPVRGISIV
jgi:hypothetical protein